MEQVFNSLISLVSEVEQVNIKDITSKRSSEAIRCRALIAFIMYKYYNCTFKEIGLHLGRSEATISRIYHFYLDLIKSSELDKRLTSKVYK